MLAEGIWLIGFGQIPQLHKIFWLATILRLLAAGFLVIVAGRHYPTTLRRPVFITLGSLAIVQLLYPIAETLALILYSTGVLSGPMPNFLHFGLVWLAFGLPGLLVAATTCVFWRQISAQ